MYNNSMLHPDNEVGLLNTYVNTSQWVRTQIYNTLSTQRYLLLYISFPLLQYFYAWGENTFECKFLQGNQWCHYRYNSIHSQKNVLRRSTWAVWRWPADRCSGLKVYTSNRPIYDHILLKGWHYAWENGTKWIYLRSGHSSWCSMYKYPKQQLGQLLNIFSTRCTLFVTI